jgi:HemY protein
MRWAIGLLGVLAVAVAAALFAGANHGTVTVFIAPHRVDVSLNLAVLAVIAFAVLVHFAWRSISALFALPQQAKEWRARQRERAQVSALVRAASHLMAGRYVRARDAATEATQLSSDESQAGLGAIAAWIAAESAHALQQGAQRDQWLGRSAELAARGGRDVMSLREGLALRSARFAIDERQADRALGILRDLPKGVARRTLALRTQMRAQRLAQSPHAALEVARLLAKHKAFTEDAAASLRRSLATEVLQRAHDSDQLRQAWAQLDKTEHAMPELMLACAQRARLVGAPALGLARLDELWLHYAALSEIQRSRMAQTLVDLLAANSPNIDVAPSVATPSMDWLRRLETAQSSAPRDAHLRYMAAMIAHQQRLWGKAKAWLEAAAPQLTDKDLARKAWRTLAELAEERDDAQAAAAAWKQAAQG